MQKGAGAPWFGNAMYCYGILSIIRFTKKVIFTYIDGFDETGMLTYILYLHELQVTRTNFYLFILLPAGFVSVMNWILLLKWQFFLVCTPGTNFSIKNFFTSAERWKEADKTSCVYSSSFTLHKFLAVTVAWNRVNIIIQ